MVGRRQCRLPACRHFRARMPTFSTEMSTCRPAEAGPNRAFIDINAGAKIPIRRLSVAVGRINPRVRRCLSRWKVSRTHPPSPGRGGSVCECQRADRGGVAKERHLRAPLVDIGFTPPRRRSLRSRERLSPSRGVRPTRRHGLQPARIICVNAVAAIGPPIHSDSHPQANATAICRATPCFFSRSRISVRSVTSAGGSPSGPAGPVRGPPPRDPPFR